MSKPPNRNWIWFFVVLALLGIASISISWVYNVKQQLTPEELAHNRALWEKNRPRSYVFAYTKQLKSARESYVVTVHDGKVQSVVMREDDAPEEVKLRPDQYGFYDMDGQFDQMERFVEMDRQGSGKRGFNRAEFDPRDGHLLRYVHSGGQAKDPVEIRVTRFEAGAP
jgi:hypothetical protein